MKYVVITEKPSAARNFAKALGGAKGTYAGKDYVIVHAVGHILELLEPHEQVADSLADRYKSWHLDYLPWNPDEMAFKVTVSGGKLDVYKNIKKALSGDTCAVIATDVDPSGEGQLIAREILEHIGYKGPVKRMNFDDEAVASLQKAFKNMDDLPTDARKDGEYMKALSRSHWDFLSMQLARAATVLAKEKGYQVVVRHGRLKSVMLKLVGDQEEARRQYVKKPYFEVKYKDDNGHTYGRIKSKDVEKPDWRFDDQADAEADKKNYTEPGTPKETERKKRSKAPGKLHDLQFISAILAKDGFSGKQVLSTYQKMYEDEVVSYPRTEDTFITPEQFKELAADVDQIADVVKIDKSLLTHRSPRSTHVKTGAAHGANRPGKNVPKSLGDLNRYGKAAIPIYTLLAKNSLAMFAEDYVYESVKGCIEEHPEFTTSFTVPLELGFKAIFDADAETADEMDDDTAENFEVGSQADLIIHEGANKKPQKPTLKWLARQLERYAVGTGATRTSTISEITSGKQRQMDEKRGNLSLTDIGLIGYVFLEDAQIGSPEVTEKLFKMMELVGKGKITYKEVIDSATAVVQKDKAVFIRNSKKLKETIGEVKGLSAQERVSGEFNGQPVSFKREFAGHRFSDDEVKQLLAGETIRIKCKSKNGSPYSVEGQLEQAMYKGRTFWAFQPDFDTAEREGYASGTWNGKDISFKGTYSSHTFTEQEIKQLLAGKDITIKIKTKAGEAEVKGKLAEKTYKGNTYVGFDGEFVGGKQAVNKEESDDYHTGVFEPTGEKVSFKKQWSTHTFSDKERDKLLAGDQIKFKAKSKKGSTYEAKGTLEKQTYKGKEFWGFKADFS